MQLLAQITGADEAITTAAKHSWEAAIIVVMIVAFMAVIIYMIRQMITTADINMKALMADATAERKLSSDREERMAARIDRNEEVIGNLEEKHTQQLVSLTEKVTEAITASTGLQEAMRQTLERMDDTMGAVNGDLKELCQLIRVCPCLLVGKMRGKYQLVDRETGKPVDLRESFDID